MKTLKERTEAAIAAGYSVGQLAIAAGKSSSAVSQWRSGLVESLKADSATGLSKLTGWSVDWWATGSGPQISEQHTGAVNKHSGTNLVRAHVVEWARLGDDLYKDLEVASGATVLDYVPIGEPGRRAKLVPVVDDSLAPRLTVGDMVAIDPDNVTPERGQVVLMRSTIDGRHFLRRYQPLIAPHFEGVDAKGVALDSQRHGLEIVGVRCGVRLADI